MYFARDLELKLGAKTITFLKLLMKQHRLACPGTHHTGQEHHNPKEQYFRRKKNNQAFNYHDTNTTATGCQRLASNHWHQQTSQWRMECSIKEERAQSKDSRMTFDFLTLFRPHSHLTHFTITISRGCRAKSHSSAPGVCTQ